MNKLIYCNRDNLLPAAKLIENYDFDEAMLKLHELTAAVVSE